MPALATQTKPQTASVMLVEPNQKYAPKQKAAPIRQKAVVRIDFSLVVRAC
jgi:hypothetical protein